MMQQDGKDPVPVEPKEIINIINGLRGNVKTLMERNSELEEIVKSQQKIVTFSDPIEQPSNNVQKLKKEIAELEFKLKHSALIEAELRGEIEMLRKNEAKPIIFVAKSKSEPEIVVSLV